MTRVRLLGVPVDRYRLIAEHHDEVIRELKLLDPESSSGELSLRLLELGPLLGPTYKAVVAPLRRAFADARERGETRADVTVDLDTAGTAHLRHLHELLDQADEASRAGELLTLPLDAHAARLRAWIVAEVLRQVDGGAEPTAWIG